MMNMNNVIKTILLGAVGPLTTHTIAAQETTTQSKYIPEFHGTVRAKYEYEPTIRKGRFEVRNARLSAEGMIVPLVRYKAEIDLSDEGQIRMLDAYLRLHPMNRLRLTFGQMRVPFGIDAHRSPHSQYFANRSFMAKQVGDVRDVGAAAAWTFGKQWSVTLEAGIFNGSGLTNQKHYWTRDYNFSFKATAVPSRTVILSASCQKARAGDVNTILYDAGMYWEYGQWHIEAEYLRKHYVPHSFHPVNAVNAFAAYRLPLKKAFTALTFLGRYDYMTDQSNGVKDDNGVLTVSNPERHRMTAGLTLSLSKKALQADIRMNYEQYFYHKGVTPSTSEQNKFVIEVVTHF